jgi:hypothetical protein
MENEKLLIVAQLPIAAICGGFVNSLKKAGMPTRYAALASAATGVVLGVLFTAGMVGTSWQALLLGGLAGLMSGLGMSGVYSGAKATIQ